MAADPITTAGELSARANRGGVLYGLTPPRQSSTVEQADDIVAASLARLRSLQVDEPIRRDALCRSAATDNLGNCKPGSARSTGFIPGWCS